MSSSKTAALGRRLPPRLIDEFLSLLGAEAAAVACCWYTRTGSSVDSTVAALPNLMRVVTAAAALITELGDEDGHEVPVVLPDVAEVKPDLFGQPDRPQHIADRLRRRAATPAVPHRRVAEAVRAQLEGHRIFTSPGRCPRAATNGGPTSH